MSGDSIYYDFKLRLDAEVSMPVNEEGDQFLTDITASELSMSDLDPCELLQQLEADAEESGYDTQFVLNGFLSRNFEATINSRKGETPCRETKAKIRITLVRKPSRKP